MKLASSMPAVAAAAAFLLAGCSSGPPHPAGWVAATLPSPGPGVGLWTNGSGPSAQSFRYEKRAFSGTLQDLGSNQVTGVVLDFHGTRLVKSTTYAPCPGLAALATFTDGADRVLLRGYSVQGSSAVLVTYIGPHGRPLDPSVGDAMRQALCVAPL